MPDKEKIEEILMKQDFLDYKWINPREIAVAQWVRVKCKFGCGDYGSGTCPPNTPLVEECDKFFKEYEHGLIIRFTKKVDKNAYPTEWSRTITNKLLQIERAVFLLGYPKVFLLNQTCCVICPDCPGNRVDCRDKENSRPSPESFAVDVYTTIRNAGMEINVVIDNPSEINRIAILLIK